MRRFLRDAGWALLFVFCGFVSAQAQHLVSSEPKGTFTKGQLNSQYGPFFQNGVKLYKILYTTTDLKSLPDTASGLLIIPDLPGAIMPLLCGEHGTVDSRNDVPSNLRGGYELGTVFGGLGYVTAMPDFLGLGASHGIHPYVHAASEASASLDMLLATREFAMQNNIKLNDQLFITGYSQGGHASMALHQDIELHHSDLFTVTAASHMSGPYSISGVMRDYIVGDSTYLFPAYVPFTVISYNEAYGLYDSLVQVFKPDFVTLVQKYYDGNITLSTLNQLLIAKLTSNYGASVPRYMFQDSVINAIINDPNHPFNVALRDNDTYNWAPQAPTRLMYCKADDQVPYRNSIVADSVMNALGAPDVMAIDVNSAADHGECVFPAVLNTYLFFEQYKNIATAIPELQAALRIHLYPNPTSDWLLMGNAPENAMVQIIDMSGKIIQTLKLKDTSPAINLQDLGTGVYIVRVSTAQGAWTGKVVVNR